MRPLGAPVEVLQAQRLARAGPHLPLARLEQVGIWSMAGTVAAVAVEQSLGTQQVPTAVLAARMAVAAAAAVLGATQESEAAVARGVERLSTSSRGR
jgi:precorrin-3B methylase